VRATISPLKDCVRDVHSPLASIRFPYTYIGFGSTRRPTMIAFTTLITLPLALAATFEVQVGVGGSPGCSPASIGGVEDGDTINFIFYPGNHTVSESSFNAPCDTLAGGFNTGFVPVKTGTIVKSFFVTHGMGTEPLAFYCGHGSLCDSENAFTIQPRGTGGVGRLGVLVATSSSLDGAANTLGSHNPSTFSGSVATAPTVADGPTGSVTSNVVPSTTFPSSTSNSTTSAPGSTGMSSGEGRKIIKHSTLTLFAIFFAVGAFMVLV